MLMCLVSGEEESSFREVLIEADSFAMTALSSAAVLHALSALMKSFKRKTI